MEVSVFIEMQISKTRKPLFVLVGFFAVVVVAAWFFLLLLFVWFFLDDRSVYKIFNRSDTKTGTLKPDIHSKERITISKEHES